MRTRTTTVTTTFDVFLRHSEPCERLLCPIGWSRRGRDSSCLLPWVWVVFHRVFISVTWRCEFLMFIVRFDLEFEHVEQIAFFLGWENWFSFDYSATYTQKEIWHGRYCLKYVRFTWITCGGIVEECLRWIASLTRIMRLAQRFTDYEIIRGDRWARNKCCFCSVLHGIV